MGPGAPLGAPNPVGQRRDRLGGRLRQPPARHGAGRACEPHPRLAGGPARRRVDPSRRGRPGRRRHSRLLRPPSGAQVRAGRARSGLPAEPRPHAYVRFLLTKPESNDFYVNRSIVASSWNRGQAFVAMSRVRLEGNLPPSLVSIRARRGGRVVSGFALDFVRHPVIGIPVVLERQSGRGWRRVATVRTTRIGGYRFRVAPGRYRARAQLGSRFSATSARSAFAPRASFARRAAVEHHSSPAQNPSWWYLRRPVEARSARPRNPVIAGRALLDAPVGSARARSVDVRRRHDRVGGRERCAGVRRACVRARCQPRPRRPPTRVGVVGHGWCVAGGVRAAGRLVP